MHASLCLFYFFQRGDAEVGPAVKAPIFGLFWPERPKNSLIN